MGIESLKSVFICICIIDSLCCIPETQHYQLYSINSFKKVKRQKYKVIHTKKDITLVNIYIRIYVLNTEAPKYVKEI